MGSLMPCEGPQRVLGILKSVHGRRQLAPGRSFPDAMQPAKARATGIREAGNRQVLTDTDRKVFIDGLMKQCDAREGVAAYGPCTTSEWPFACPCPSPTIGQLLRFRSEPRSLPRPLPCTP